MASVLHFGDPDRRARAIQQAHATSRPAPPRSGRAALCQRHVQAVCIACLCMQQHGLHAPRTKQAKQCFNQVICLRGHAAKPQQPSSSDEPGLWPCPRTHATACHVQSLPLQATNGLQGSHTPVCSASPCAEPGRASKPTRRAIFQLMPLRGGCQHTSSKQPLSEPRRLTK